MVIAIESGLKFPIFLSVVQKYTLSIRLCMIIGERIYWSMVHRIRCIYGHLKMEKYIFVYINLSIGRIMRH